ncbi:hypothetical protein HY971_04485 [Candidatus Kaiserbacteria bacterium]|nr:hypothetical protein [Candidatus Kaiserbacteria bacterium]
MHRALIGLGRMAGVCFPLLLPTIASAHEVYVLDPSAVAAGMATASPNPFTAYSGNELSFFFWGFIVFVTTLTILFVSLFRVFERLADPLLFSLKQWAHPLVRLTVGACLLSFGIAGKLYGTEIDTGGLFGSWGVVMQALFVLGGVVTIAGIYVRTVAILSLTVYAYAASALGWYVLTYADHLGSYLLLLVLGAGSWSLENFLHRGYLPHPMRRYLQPFVPFAFPVMRVLFGFGLIFAAVYAKFIHTQLALDVVQQYHLTTYFPFDPLFIVLGALIIESAAGLMMLLGIEIRWTALFLVFWLTLSLLYFQEAVWPHLILFGLGIALFFHGYDRYSLEGRFFKRHGIEPVL